MGLINEVNNISQEIKTQNTEKERREAERKRKEREKENLQIIDSQVTRFLEYTFANAFESYGSNYDIEFLNLNKKFEILNHCEQQLVQYMKKNKNFDFAKNEQIYSDKIYLIFDKNYYKILKEQKTIYLNNEKYLFNKQLREAEQQQQQQTTKKETFQKINKAAGQAASIGILAAAGGLSILLGAAIKGSNKKRRF